MTTPSIIPASFQGNATDYLKTKVERDGSARLQAQTTSVPTGTTTTTIVGLIPFNAGCRILPDGISAAVDALGTSVTMSLGVVYDDNVGNTNNATLFTSASTAAAAGGTLAVVNSATNIPYVTTGNGWLVATIGGATTGTTGNVYIQIAAAYDGLTTPN